MTTSQNLKLFEPVDGAAVPSSTLSYFRYRFKQRIFNSLMKEFRRSNMTKAELARRLEKDPGQISKVLSGPGNVTLDTVSDVLFAISGAELSMVVDYPLAAKLSAIKSTIELKPIASTGSTGMNIKNVMQPQSIVEYA